MYPKVFQELIDHFSSLPSVGPKMAERLVLHLFNADSDKLDDFSEAISALQNLSTCTTCFNIAEDDLCVICKDDTREKSKLCVVEEAIDIIPLERARAYDGRYHVLGGTIDKNDDDTDLKIAELLSRVEEGKIKEVIIATNFTTAGDMTALYLKKKLHDEDVQISRLARGLATGSDIEYADDMTLRSALSNRAEM